VQLDVRLKRFVPSPVRGLDDRIEFSPHLVFAENFGIDAAEAALGLQCELL
jgi:hypothetical protein